MLEHLPNHSEQTSDQHGTFPVLSSLFSSDSEYTKTHLKHHRAKCITLPVREHSRHDRDSSPINDQQGALESNADPCALHDVVSSLNRKRRVLFPLYYDTWFVRAPIFSIQYLCSISLPTNTFTRSRDITSA